MFKEVKAKFNEMASFEKKGDSFTGFLVGVKNNVGKHKSNVLQFQTGAGEARDVWGSGAIDSRLLTPDGRIKPEFVNRLVRLTYRGELKIKGRKEPMHDFLVEVDTAKKLKASKTPL